MTLSVGRASPQFSCQERCRLWVKHRTGSQGDKVASLHSACSPSNLWGPAQRADLREDTMWDRKLAPAPGVAINPGLFWGSLSSDLILS